MTWITSDWTPAFAGVTNKGEYFIVIPAEAGIHDLSIAQTTMALWTNPVGPSY